MSGHHGPNALLTADLAESPDTETATVVNPTIPTVPAVEKNLETVAQMNLVAQMVRVA